METGIACSGCSLERNPLSLGCGPVILTKHREGESTTSHLFSATHIDPVPCPFPLRRFLLPHSVHQIPFSQNHLQKVTVFKEPSLQITRGFTSPQKGLKGAAGPLQGHLCPSLHHPPMDTGHCTLLSPGRDPRLHPLPPAPHLCTGWFPSPRPSVCLASHHAHWYCSLAWWP